MELHEAIRHFKMNPSEELRHWVDEDILSDSRYLFYKVEPVTKSVMAYCTYCETEYQTEQQLKHNVVTECKNCSSYVRAKQAFRKRGKMLDVAYVEFAEKSVIDDNTVTVSGYYVFRDYRKSYHAVQTQYVRLALYVFKLGEAHIWKRTLWDDCDTLNSFEKGKSVRSLGRSTMKFVQCYLSRPSFEEAVKQTPFRFIQWQQYSSDILLEYFELTCKYPIVEVLTKIGLRNIIYPYLAKRPKDLTLNWRGKTLDRIIGLAKSDWSHIKKLPRAINGYEISVIIKLRSKGITMPFLELFKICNDLGFHNMQSLNLVLLNTGASIKKIYNYVYKQFELHPDHYRSVGQTFITYSDYLTECNRTNVNLSINQNKYPKDVRGSHQRQIERQKAIADLKLNLQFKKRVKELNKFSFSSNNLMIRPITDAKELANESNKLIHCVSSYGSRYAKGETNLFVIRKTDDIETPFYTVELSKQLNVIQVRGYKNADATDEVEKFMKDYKCFLKRFINEVNKGATA